MSRFMMTIGLAASICCAIAFAGETTIIEVKKIPLNGGKAIEIQVEGTNKLKAGETFVGWTPVFVQPNGQLAPAAVVEFTPPAPGGNPTKFKYRYVVTDLQTDKGRRSVHPLNGKNPMVGAATVPKRPSPFRKPTACRQRRSRTLDVNQSSLTLEVSMQEGFLWAVARFRDQD